MNIPFATGEVKPSFDHFSFFNPGFFFKVLTSFAAMALPNWRDLELAVGLVHIGFAFAIIASLLELLFIIAMSLESLHR